MAASKKKETLAPSLDQRKGRFQFGKVNVTLDTTDEFVSCEEGNESGIECVCCFEEFPFEEMVQCSDGHLVCLKCFATYTTHQTYGSVKLELQCMAEGCSASYPRSEMIRCLSPNTVTKWDERIQEENLRMSELELTRCPHCHFACVLSPTIQKMRCPRETCKKNTCRMCGVDWDEHKGKTCIEVEKEDETSLRKSKKMTKATLRSCDKCSTPFVKEDGCNKMVCHCGATMCYICRENNIDYKHFCTHAHSPGKGCISCNKCYLWTSSKEDDERAIAELKKEASRKRKKLGYDTYKAIGAPTAESRKTTKN